MATRVQSGTSAMCMATDPPERRECVPMYSGAYPILAAPTIMVSAQRTAMMSKAPNKRRSWAVGQLSIWVDPRHPCSRMRRKMLTPAWTVQAATNSDWKCEIDSPQIAFLCLSRASMIWVACWKCSTGVLAGRSRPPTKKTKSMRGRNWTVWLWPVHLVNFNKLR